MKSLATALALCFAFLSTAVLAQSQLLNPDQNALPRERLLLRGNPAIAIAGDVTVTIENEQSWLFRVVDKDPSDPRDLYIRFRSDTRLPALPTANFGRASVLYGRTFVLISPTEGPSLLINLRGHRGAAASASVNAQKEVEGIEIAAIRADVDSPFLIAPEKNASVQCKDTNSCSAGGKGSTECSITINPGACSVSCASGFYACCNFIGGCHCIEIVPCTPGGGQ
jgi:hypothetical protein